MFHVFDVTYGTGVYADVMELVDMQDLGSCVEIRVGSSPFIRTKYRALVQPLESGIFIPFLPFSPISVRLRSTSWEGTSPIRCATGTSRFSAHFIRTKYPQINVFVCLWIFLLMRLKQSSMCSKLSFLYFYDII